jgi:hypothetical protein
MFNKSKLKINLF